MKFIEKCKKLQEEYKDDYEVRKNGTLRLHPGKNLYARHMFYKGLNGDMLHELSERLGVSIPQEYIEFLQFSNGADLYTVKVRYSEEIKFSHTLFCILGLPMTDPLGRPDNEEEPIDIEVEKLARHKKIPRSWLKCGCYQINLKTKEYLDIFIDTEDGKVYSCVKNQRDIIDSWDNLDDCFCSILDALSNTADAYDGNGEVYEDVNGELEAWVNTSIENGTDDNEINEEVAIKIGDWVTGYSKGYFQVAGFIERYSDDPSDAQYGYKLGQRLPDLVQLKKGFTPMLAYKLDVDVCDIDYIRPVKESVENKISLYFEKHPDKKNAFDEYKAAEKIGSYYCIVWMTEEEKKSWEDTLKQLPEKFKWNKITDLFRYGLDAINHNKNKKGKKNQRYIVTCELDKTSVQIGKEPLYCNPVIYMCDEKII